MKPFDLQEALNGAPVRLRNGCKAFIFKNIQNTPVVDFDVDYPLIGMIHNHPVAQTWSLDGRISLCNDCAPGDIVSMWEEPNISIEDLTKPFQPDIGDKFYYISTGGVSYYSFYTDWFAELKRNGQCFKTEQDAQKWLDSMKGMME